MEKLEKTEWDSHSEPKNSPVKKTPLKDPKRAWATLENSPATLRRARRDEIDHMKELIAQCRERGLTGSFMRKRNY